MVHLRSGAHGPDVHGDGTVTFSLWAPVADEVTLVLEGDEQPMERGAHDWWRLHVPAGHGARYGFRLDGGEVRPDPASRRQPDGVHGLSAVVDPSRLGGAGVPTDWRPPDLIGGAVYELHVGTFTPEGTLDAAADRIGHLPDLGITHVEVMPVNAFNGERGWGYDGVGWYAVHEPYGGPEAFGRFVGACHDLGLAVILDVVHNHLGPSGNYLPELGPYLGTTGTWGSGLNLDGPHSDAVRDLIVGNVAAWFRDHGVDALRLDAVHALHDDSATHILAELAETARTLGEQLGRTFQLIAESDRNDPATITPRAVGGLGMDAQWADELHHAIHVAVTGEHEGYYVDTHPQGLPDVAAAYRKGFVLDGSRYSTFRQRTVGAPLPDDVDGRRLVACIQNHDQVGNRPSGDRLVAGIDPALVRVAALLLCAAPHTPMLFMGEEHGETNPFQYFTSHPEPELADAVRTGRREEFSYFSAAGGPDVPDPQDPETFARSRIDWAKADTAEGHAWTALWTDLLAARAAHEALGGGRRDRVATDHLEPGVLSLRRGGEPNDVQVMVNLGQAAVTLPSPEGAEVLLTTTAEHYGGNGATVSVEGGTVTLPPRSGALLLSPAR